jgi:hypothetical protein
MRVRSAAQNDGMPGAPAMRALDAFEIEADKTARPAIEG